MSIPIGDMLPRSFTMCIRIITTTSLLFPLKSLILQSYVAPEPELQLTTTATACMQFLSSIIFGSTNIRYNTQIEHTRCHSGVDCCCPILTSILTHCMLVSVDNLSLCVKFSLCRLYLTEQFMSIECPLVFVRACNMRASNGGRLKVQRLLW